MAIPTSRSRNNKSRTNTSSSTTTSTASSSSPSSHHPLLMNNNNNNPTLCPTTATAPYAYYTPQYFTASAHHVGAPILISTATATTAATAAATTSHHSHHAFPIYPFQPIPLSHQQQQQLYLPTITMNSATFDLMNNSDHDDNDNNHNKSHSHKNNHNKKNDKPSSVFLSCPSPKKEVHHHHNSTTPTVVTTPTTPTLMTLDTDQSNTSSFLLLDTNNYNSDNNDNNNNSIDINNNINNDVNNVNNDDNDDGYYCCDSILNQEQFELQQQQPLDGEWNDVLMLIDNNSSETSPFISLTSSSLSSPSSSSSSSSGSSHDNVGDDDDLMMMRNISSEDDNDDGSPSLMAMMMDRDGYDEDDIVNDDEYLRALTHDHSSLSSENVVETATKKRRVSKSESVNVSSVSPSLSGDESSELSLSPSPVNSSSSSSSSNKRKREVSEEIDDERELNRLNQIPTSQLTDADKRLKKKLRNRQSARRSRENKKHELQVAQELNAQLTSTCTQLKHEVNDLKAKVQLLEKENEQLKLQLKLTNEPLKSDKSLFKNNVSKAKTVMLFSVLFCVGFLFHCLPSLFSSNTPIGSSTPALYNMPSSYGPMEASPSAMYPYHNRRGVNRQGMRLLTASPSSDNDEQKSQHQLPQHEEESISVEKEQTSQNESQFFNGEQMIKKQVVYPHPLKQHFSLGTKETLGTEKRLVSLPDTVESRILNDGLVGDFSLQNSKQLAMIPMALTHEASSAFLYNQMNRRGLEVGHTYQIPQERFIDDDASVRLICPYIYPLLNKNAPRGENMGNFRMQDLKNKYIKLLVPIQTINTDQGRRVVRMAEISARDISFGELYLEM